MEIFSCTSLAVINISGAEKQMHMHHQQQQSSHNNLDTLWCAAIVCVNFVAFDPLLHLPF